MIGKAFYLCDHHAPTDPTAAVFAYNHADTYVTAVLAHAASLPQTASPRTAWPPQRAQVADPSGTGGYVTARTAALYHALAASGATREGATCWDPHLQNPDSDHRSAKPATCSSTRTTPPTSPAAGPSPTGSPPPPPPPGCRHQADDGVHYVIWQGLIWSTEHPTWTTYRSTIYGCPNPANLTGCHYNHIHFSAY